MSAVLLLDTSVYLNVLDVGGFNQDREQVLDEFARRLKANDCFLLPLATIWETGNHIADLANGSHRFRFASKLVTEVQKAMRGELPYQATHFPQREEFLSWLSEFPDHAKRNKSAKKTREGVSLADVSLIQEWKRNCRLNPQREVRIWSLDSDLQGYVQNGS